MCSAAAPVLGPAKAAGLLLPCPCSAALSAASQPNNFTKAVAAVGISHTSSLQLSLLPHVKTFGSLASSTSTVA